MSSLEGLPKSLDPLVESAVHELPLATMYATPVPPKLAQLVQWLEGKHDHQSRCI